MCELPGRRPELLDGVVGQDRCVPDRDVHDRHHEQRPVTRHEELDHGCLGSFAELDHRAREGGLGECSGGARTEQVNDHDRVVNAGSGWNREHERVAEERVGEMIEGIRQVLFLAALSVQPGHAIEDLSSADSVEDAAEGGPGRRRGARQLTSHRHAVDDDRQAGPLADMFEQGGRLRPGIGLERCGQRAGGTGPARQVPLEVELGDPPVAPEILVGGGRRALGEAVEGSLAPVGEPIGPAETPRRVTGEGKG